MAKIKSSRHHWWPECVSDFWKDADGCVTRVTSDGHCVTQPPQNFGSIQNGHLIKLADDPSAFCPWDQSYEEVFRHADNHFPNVIGLLHSVPSEDRRHLNSLRSRYCPHAISDEDFDHIVEAVVSLAVRSPRTRDRAVALAEGLRGPLEKRQRNGIIGMNLRNFHCDVMSNTKRRGKIAVLYSPDREFIFGDGFYHDLISPPMVPHAPKIVVPLSPTMTVIYARPTSYLDDPRLVTMVMTDGEVQAMNDTIQIYSRAEIFYRSQRPDIIEPFERGEHLVYGDNEHLVFRLLESIPGFANRDRDLDSFPARFGST